MDQQLLLLALLGACSVAMIALLLRIRREGDESDETRDSPIAMSSEGVKLCPSCATENLWTDTRCVRCGRHLPDAPARAW